MADIIKADILKYIDGKIENLQDSIIMEKPLNIYVNNGYYTTLMCTPHMLKELCAGFLYSEGIVSDVCQIQGFEQKGEDMIFVTLDREIKTKSLHKRALISGCGRGSIDINLLNENKLEALNCDRAFSINRILEYMSDFSRMSELFRQTGGVHSCGIFGDNGIEAMCEDIGRHNAIDKAVGQCLLNGVNMGSKMLFTTGRISSDTLIKTSKAGIGVLVSRSGPTSLAVDMARKLNISVIGFARGKRANIYSCPDRISIGGNNE